MSRDPFFGVPGNVSRTFFAIVHFEILRAFIVGSDLHFRQELHRSRIFLGELFIDDRFDTVYRETKVFTIEGSVDIVFATGRSVRGTVSQTTSLPSTRTPEIH